MDGGRAAVRDIAVFDALGDGLDLPLLGGVDDPADCALHDLVGHQRVHEFAVDLDVVGFQQVEYLEAFLVDAVVLDSEADTKLA